MKTTDQSGFAAIEAVLVLVIVAMIGGTGYFVWHAKQNTDASLNNTAKSQLATQTKKKQASTKPSVSTNYLTIKEWGVKIPLSTPDAGAYYKLDAHISQSATDPTNLTIYATEIDKLVGPAGVSCEGEYIAFLLRLPNDDPTWQPSTSVDDGKVSPLYGERITLGNYKYAIATKKQYGPSCWETSKTGDYNVDGATSQKFSDVVNAFVTDFKHISTE